MVESKNNIQFPETERLILLFEKEVQTKGFFDSPTFNLSENELKLIFEGYFVKFGTIPSFDHFKKEFLYGNYSNFQLLNMAKNAKRGKLTAKQSLKV